MKSAGAQRLIDVVSALDVDQALDEIAWNDLARRITSARFERARGDCAERANRKPAGDLGRNRTRLKVFLSSVYRNLTYEEKPDDD